MFATLSDMFSGGKNLPRWSRTVAAMIFSANEELGCVSAIDSEGRTIWIVDAHRVTMSLGFLEQTAVLIV
jgi:hypothetical protein